MRIIELNSENLESKLKGIRGITSPHDRSYEAIVKKIVDEVRENGDKALFKFTKKFDRFDVSRKTVRVSKLESEIARKKVPQEVASSLKIAASRIYTYQRKKLPREKSYSDTLGNELGWIMRPIERVGIYVPGGKASYPSTVLMTAIPAKVAGVKEVVLVTPCPEGELNPSVLFAASMAGVDGIFKVGGAQAVAALAYGTESIPKVDKIVGPGNIYVSIAKKLVFGDVGIDMIAGPSEVLIISDGSLPPQWVAADLLAQAEHDEMAVPTLVTNSKGFALNVRREILRSLKHLKRSDIIRKALQNQGRIFLVNSLEDAVSVSNIVAPEHLELCVKKPKSLLKWVKNAGAIFLGSLTTEAFGDYVAGSSHVLPTSGTARFSSPLSVYDFLKMPSVLSISKKGFKKLGKTVISLANSEGLEAHSLSVKVRYDS